MQGANLFFYVASVVLDVTGNLEELTRHSPADSSHGCEAKNQYDEDGGDAAQMGFLQQADNRGEKETENQRQS